MAKRKRSKRTKKTSSTSKSLRVDSSLLTTLIDEIDELVELLRFLPELNILSNFSRERAREMEETVVDHDRIATIAMNFFGRDLDKLDQEERDNACEAVPFAGKLIQSLVDNIPIGDLDVIQEVADEVVDSFDLSFTLNALFCGF